MAGMGEGAATEEHSTLTDRRGYLGNRIHVSFDFLCNNSTNLPVVLVHLISNNVITQHESEVVENQLSNYAQFRQLYTFLRQRVGHGDNSRHFVDAFQNSGNEHILEKLKSATVTKDFDPGPPETPYHSVRFNVQEPVSSFVGRENFLRDLHQHILQSYQTTADVSTTSTIISRILVVTGLGGIGKTETIRKYIHRYGPCYQHVVWIDAEEHNTAENQFRRLARELQLPSKDIDNKAKDFDVILEEIYDRLCTSNTLIVLDNAEALHDSDPKRPGVAGFLPKCLLHTLLKPVIIITSRQLDWPDIHSLPLTLLTQQESSTFISSQLKLEESAANAKDAEMLSETFGGLPLALQAAAAVIRQESKQNELMGKDVYAIQHLLSDYNQEKRKVLEKRPPGSPDTLPLMLLWKVSLDKIQQQAHGHLATQILNVMAHLSSTNIPKDLLFFIFNSNEEQSLKNAVELLVDYSFVHNFRSHFSIHRMLQDVTLAHLKAHTLLKSWLTWLWPSSAHPLMRITDALMEYWPTLPKSSETYDAVHDNLIHVAMNHVLPKAQSTFKKDFHFIKFIGFVMKEINGNRWMEAEKCGRVLIANFTSSARPLSNCATPFQSHDLRTVMLAQLTFTLILEERERLKEANESLSSLNSLEDQKEVIAEIHRLNSTDIQEEYEEVVKLFYYVADLLPDPTHKITARMKDPGQHHLKTLTAKLCMAMILAEGDRYASTLNFKIGMADLLEQQGSYEEALRLYAHVISRYEKASASGHPDCLKAKNNMAMVLMKQERVDEAKEMLCHVLDARERLLGPSHVDTHVTKRNVAWVLEKQGRHAEALKLYEDVLELRTTQLGPVHPRTFLANINIGWLHVKMGNFKKAESIAKEVLAARKATLTTNAPTSKTEALSGEKEKVRLLNEA